MIGQKPLLKHIDNLDMKNLSKFIIVNGFPNSGKSLIVNHLANKIGDYAEVEKSVDSVREMIKTAYYVSSPILYFIKDSENMSAQAINSLLKVTEEPPQNAYFIITANNLDKILPTIRSRATTLNMTPYKPEELVLYAKKLVPELNDKELRVISLLCSTTGDVNKLVGLNILELWKSQVRLVDDIPSLSGIELLKISSTLKIKEDDKGLDPLLFLNSLGVIFLKKLMEAGETKMLKNRFTKSIRYIAQCKQDYLKVGINKTATIDLLLINLRKVWR